MQSASAARPTANQLLSSLTLCLGASFLSATLTNIALANWFPGLEKPEWMPPNWTFALSWMVSGLLMGVALSSLRAAPATQRAKRVTMAWFWSQLGFALLWAALFFAWRSPAWGYFTVFCWWLALAGLLWTGSKLSRRAFWLLVPTFLWVTFASALNFSILSLNVLKPKTEELEAMPTNQDPSLQFRKSAPGTREDAHH